MGGAITRRTLIGKIACLSALAQTSDDPLRLLRAGHPRLILPDPDLIHLRQLVRENTVARRAFGDLEKECDRLLSTPPVEYRVIGGRLQVQTRRAVDRITTLALMFRLTGRDPWLRRAIMELNAAANFKDWNPARFVETAEMAHAFAIGYDWLYNSLSTEERIWVKDALVSKAIDACLPTYRQKTWWTRERFDWNVVCNAGMAMAALAVADDAPDKSREVLGAALESIPHGLATFGTDGGWPDGPFYGEYAARYACLFLASLSTALGSTALANIDGSLHGLDRFGRFRIHTTGPTNRAFNFADETEDQGMAPELFWLSRRLNAPAYVWSEQRQLERSMHPDAYDLAWFDRDSKAPPAPPASLDAFFHGVSVATFRSAWEDPNALFVAVKGGDNKSTHAHFDLGTFVLDAGGVRWAVDLGPDDPAASLPRSASYRIRTEAHNTLLIEGENQDPRAEARITHQDTGPELSWVQIELSKASPRIRQWTRRVGIAQRQAVLIGDSLRGDQPVEVLWGMMTDSDVSINGPSAVLHKNGWNLSAEIRSPRHAVFDLAPVRATGPQAQNPKLQKLIVRLFEKVTELDLNIVLTPYRDGQTRPKIATQFPA